MEGQYYYAEILRCALRIGCNRIRDIQKWLLVEE